MSNLQEAVVVISRKATADVEPNRMINVAGTHTGLGELAVGVSQSVTSNGQMIPVAVGGVFQVEASGAIAAGSGINSDADGKARVAAPSFGVALTSASADGDLIDVLWTGPVTIA